MRVSTKELLLKSHEQISLLEPGIGTKNMSSLTFLLELMHINFRNEYNLQHRGKIFLTIILKAD